MKLRVDRDTFADAVAWAARTLPVRPPVPVLAGLMLTATDEGQGTLALSSFDYEVSAHAEIGIEVAEPGRTLVSGRLLAEISRALPAQPVDIVVDGPRAVLTCGSVRFALPTLPVDDYPALPEMPSAAGSLAAEDFAAAVAQVAIAAGRDDTLPVLTGVRVEIDGEKLTLAATDRYRLAVRELHWQPEQAGIEAVALVPARTLHDAARALTSGSTVTIALQTTGTGEGLIGFSGSGGGSDASGSGLRRTTTRLLDGEFVKYRSLLPSESAATAHVDTGALVEAVKRVALVAPRNTPVRLSLSPEVMVLEAGTGEDAQATESIAVRFEGADNAEDFVVAFNPAYLLDGLGAVGAPVTQINFTTPTKPAVLRAGDDSDADKGDDYRYLLMPVRLAG